VITLTQKEKEIFDTLTAEEKELTLNILKDLQQTGKSDLLEELWKQDYEEIPVSIDEFIENPYYIGKSFDNGEAIYPYWRNELRTIFKETGRFQEVALTGSIGIGKSTIACVALSYLIYKLMCLKNPQNYYHIAAGSNITIAFFNITLDLTDSVGFNTTQEILMNSDWFLERGKILGTVHKHYQPDKKIVFKAGSNTEHSLGQHIFCMVGDTEILTDKGIKKLEDLEGQNIKVFSQDDQGNIILSNSTTVLKTQMTKEVYEIKLENGSILKCTPNHLLRLKDGSYKRVDKLSEKDELMDVDYKFII